MTVSMLTWHLCCNGDVCQSPCALTGWLHTPSTCRFESTAATAALRTPPQNSRPCMKQHLVLLLAHQQSNATQSITSACMCNCRTAASATCATPAASNCCCCSCCCHATFTRLRKLHCTLSDPQHSVALHVHREPQQPRCKESSSNSRARPLMPC